MSRSPIHTWLDPAYSEPQPAERLLTLVSAETRRRLAARLGKAFSRGEGSRAQRLLAVELLKLLARDTEVKVRQALADHLKSSPSLPRTIAQRLAADVESVALPLLSVSPVFTDDDLIAIILSGNTAKQSDDERLIISGLVREYRQLNPDGLEGVLDQISQLPPDQ